MGEKKRECTMFCYDDTGKKDDGCIRKLIALKGSEAAFSLRQRPLVMPESLSWGSLSSVVFGVNWVATYVRREAAERAGIGAVEVGDANRKGCVQKLEFAESGSANRRPEHGRKGVEVGKRVRAEGSFIVRQDILRPKMTLC